MLGLEWSPLLRHSDIRPTDRIYAHLSPEVIQNAVEALIEVKFSLSDFTLRKRA